MPTGWFIVPFTRRSPASFDWLLYERYLAIVEQESTIAADGGAYRYTEIRNNRALVKVRASASTLSTLNGLPGWKRLPKDLLNDPLSTLTVNQRNAIRNELLDQGYTLAEVNARFPDGIQNYTLGDVLRFITRRRRRMAYDSGTDGLIESVEEFDCAPTLDALNTEVT